MFSASLWSLATAVRSTSDLAYLVVAAPLALVVLAAGRTALAHPAPHSVALVDIRARSVDVDLYFLGSEPTAPLIELQLKIRGCHEDELEQWMRSAFGPPIRMASMEIS